MQFIVTGGAGFIGSNLAQKLLKANSHVVIIDDLSTGKYRNVKQLLSHPFCTFIQANITQGDKWEHVLHKGDTIIHLAATVGVKRVCVDPFETVTNNIKGVETVLAAALKYQCKVFYASSSEVYGQSASASLHENDALLVYADQGGRSSYVLSKLLGEHICLNYYDRYKLPVVIGRFFNVGGIHQSSDYGMVIPTFVQQALAGKDLIVYGNGSQQRSFCNVWDTTNAICLLMNNEQAYGQVFNIGNTEAITIRSLAEYILEETGSASSIRFEDMPYERSDGKDIYRRRPCIDKITNLTGWRPAVSWRTTVKDVIAETRRYYKANKLKEKMI